MFLSWSCWKLFKTDLCPESFKALIQSLQLAYIYPLKMVEISTFHQSSKSILYCDLSIIPHLYLEQLLIQLTTSDSWMPCLLSHWQCYSWSPGWDCETVYYKSILLGPKQLWYCWWEAEEYFSWQHMKLTEFQVKFDNLMFQIPYWYFIT